MPTRAPIVASPIAVAFPMPPVPPVIRTTLPAMGCVPAMVRGSGGDATSLRSVGLGLKSFEEDPEGQHQLKENPWNREVEADVDPKDFSDGSCHEKGVADQARNRQP